MAKLTLNSIGSRYGSLDALNDNFDQLEQAVENTLSRDGTGPNAMEANLDMNGNTILNVGALAVNSLSINGVNVVPTGTIVAPLPTQTGQNGRLLATDGTTAFWQVPSTSQLTFLQQGTGAVSRTAQEKIRESVSVLDFLPTGVNPSLDANWAAVTAAFNSALATGKPVYVPAGTYVVENVALTSGCIVFGDGFSSIIRQRASAASNRWCFEYGSASATDTGTSTNAQGIVLRDLQFRGRVDTEGFQEFVHLVHLSGVSDTLVERCLFRGFRGDGLYIGSTVVGNERHNRSVTVRNCVFDGLNRDNRNGISVIDCNGLRVDSCYFVNCTRSNMPGAIDIEPDAAVYHVIHDISIVNCKFENCGGTNGGIGVYLPNVAWTTQPSGFYFAGNDIDGGSTYIDRGIFFQHEGDATTARNHDIRIVGNRVTRTSRGFDISGARNIRISENVFNETSLSPLVGFSSANKKNIDVQLLNNTFYRIGWDNTNGGEGVNVFTVDNIDIIGNRFIDCGRANGTGGIAINFNTGASTFVRLRHNLFQTPTAKGTIAVQQQVGHTFTVASNVNEGNDRGGMSNFFVPRDGAVVYDPPSLADGAGVTTTVTTPGAAVGDFVVVAFNQPLQGITVTAWVSAVDTVSVRFQNETGGAVDLASGTLYARISKL